MHYNLFYLDKRSCKRSRSVKDRTDGEESLRALGSSLSGMDDVE